MTRDTALAMSQENVEIVRRGYEAFERRDIAAMLGDVHPNLVSHRAPPQPDAGTWNGPEGLLQAIAGWIEGFDEFAMTVTEVIDPNDTQVIVRVHQSAVGSQSRAPIEADFWLLHTLSDQKIVRVDFYAREEQAFEAAGFRD